ncbi:hypothetical protein PENSPDRAFT_673899 [Peniophora sp. CONT]|nr:hypothetical protein PENSPDRAFT_673899 [Peniophora sp. CONT]
MGETAMSGWKHYTLLYPAQGAVAPSTSLPDSLKYGKYYSTTLRDKQRREPPTPALHHQPPTTTIMSTSRASPSSPSSPPSSSSKFSKLLSKPNRDRSRSLAEPSPPSSSSSSSGLPPSSLSSPPSSSLSTPLPHSHSHSGHSPANPELPPSARRSSILGRNGGGSRFRRHRNDNNAGGGGDEGMMTDIGERVPTIPTQLVPGNYVRARTRSERPLSNPPAIASAASYPSNSASTPHTTSRGSSGNNHLGVGGGGHGDGGAKISDRLSGWFNHTFNTSANDLSLPHILQRSTSPTNLTLPTSPDRRLLQNGGINSNIDARSGSSTEGSNSNKGGGGGKVHGLLTAARTGKGHLDRAMRYILDTDAAPDRCTSPIWVLGVEHPGFTPSPNHSPSSSTSGRRSSISVEAASVRSNGSREREREEASLSRSTPPGGGGRKSKDHRRNAGGGEGGEELGFEEAGKGWPPEFYNDFTSRVWLTYRSQFPPIRDTTLHALDMSGSDNASLISSSPSKSRWAWAGFGERGWTSDAGWGCMLRTGQSLLANSLVHLHLGRDWRRPAGPQATAAYARYVEILTWFMDAPTPQSPFSVHRMALAGKELGKDVGQWFGPSTAAGALKTLTDAYPDAHLGVCVAVDSQVFQTDVFAASWDPRAAVSSHRKRTRWGGRAVLVLVGLRLGLDGVNPIYYESVKTLFTWPQSVGIAGGRPSSSYYFVGTQADSLFYLDPHHARPAVPLRPPPQATFSSQAPSTPPLHGPSTPPLGGSSSPEPIPIKGRGNMGPPQTPVRASVSRDEEERERRGHTRSPTSPPPGRAHAASPLAKELSTSSSNSSSSNNHGAGQGGGGHTRWRTTAPAPGSPGQVSVGSGGQGSGSLIGSSASLLALDGVQQHYVGAYSAQEIRTFSCEKVRKLPLAGLDPSMLLGFLVKDEREWRDLRARVVELGKTHRAIFSVQDEPPSWPSDADSDMGLESLSEPDSPDGLSVGGDVKVLREDGDSDDEADGDFFDASEVPARADSSASSASDSLIDPLTPGAGARGSFDLRALQIKPISNETFESTRDGPLDDDEGELIGEDEWVVDEDSIGVPVTPREVVYTRPEPRERVETVRPGEKSVGRDDHVRPERAERPGRQRTERPAERSPSVVKVATRQASESSTFTTSSVASSASASSRTDPERATKKEREKDGSREKEKEKGKGKKKKSVPVPFPSASADVEEREERRVPQMSDRRGRDGGRTQSGGVRGILNEDA